MVYLFLKSPSIEEVPVTLGGTDTPTKDKGTGKKSKDGEKAQGNKSFEETPVRLSNPNDPSAPTATRAEPLPEYTPSKARLGKGDQVLSNVDPEDIGGAMYFRAFGMYGWQRLNHGPASAILARHGQGNIAPTYGVDLISEQTLTAGGLTLGTQILNSNFNLELSGYGGVISGTLDDLHNPDHDLWDPDSIFSGPEPARKITGSTDGNQGGLGVSIRYNTDYVGFQLRSLAEWYQVSVNSSQGVPVDESQLSDNPSSQNGRPIIGLSGSFFSSGLGLTLHLSQLTEWLPFELYFGLDLLWNVDSQVEFGAPEGSNGVSAVSQALEASGNAVDGVRFTFEGRTAYTDTSDGTDHLLEVKAFDYEKSITEDMETCQKYIKIVDSRIRDFHNATDQTTKQKHYDEALRIYELIKPKLAEIDGEITQFERYTRTEYPNARYVYNFFDQNDKLNFFNTKWVVKVHPGFPAKLLAMANELDVDLPDFVPIARPPKVEVTKTKDDTPLFLGFSADDISENDAGNLILTLPFRSPFNDEPEDQQSRVKSPIYTLGFESVPAHHLALPDPASLATDLNKTNLRYLEQVLSLYLSDKDAKALADFIKGIKEKLDKDPNAQITIKLTHAKRFTDYASKLKGTLATPVIFKGMLVELLKAKPENIIIEKTDGEMNDDQVTFTLDGQTIEIDLDSKPKLSNRKTKDLNDGIYLPFQSSGTVYVLKVSPDKQVEVLRYVQEGNSSKAEPLSKEDKSRLRKDFNYETTFPGLQKK